MADSIGLTWTPKELIHIDQLPELPDPPLRFTNEARFACYALVLLAGGLESKTESQLRLIARQATNSELMSFREFADSLGNDAVRMLATIVYAEPTADGSLAGEGSTSLDTIQRLEQALAASLEQQAQYREEVYVDLKGLTQGIEARLQAEESARESLGRALGAEADAHHQRLRAIEERAETEAARLEAEKADFAEARKAAAAETAALQAALKSAREDGPAVLAKATGALEAAEALAKEVNEKVDLLAGKGLSKEYATLASRASWRAICWQLLVVGSLLGLLWVLFLRGGQDLEYRLLRSLTSYTQLVPFLLGAAYAGRQAAVNRRMAAEYRHLELGLRVINKFGEEQQLPDRDRHDLTQMLAKRVFGRSPVSNDGGSPLESAMKELSGLTEKLTKVVSEAQKTPRTLAQPAGGTGARNDPPT